MDGFTVDFLLTFMVALSGGLMFSDKWKVPAGGIIGSMLFVGIFNILFGFAEFPRILKVLVQSLSGGYIGIRIKRQDIQSFKTLLVPITIMLIGLLSFNIGWGFLISRLGGINLATALLATTPGGITEVSMMCEEMGATPAIVTIMQMSRIIFVISTFPTMLSYISRRYDPHESSNPQQTKKNAPQPITKESCKTAALALVAGYLGWKSGLPAGTISFSMLAAASYNVMTGKGTLPGDKRKFVQIGAGLTIGCGITMADLAHLQFILLPTLLMLAGFVALNLLLSVLISKTKKVDLTTALFSTSPAGVSDMALIAMDVGGDTPKIASMQLVRMLSAVTIFPMVIRFILSYLA